MKAKNLDTESKREDSETPKLEIDKNKIVLMHLSTGDLVISTVPVYYEGFILTAFPYEVVILYDANDNIEGFSIKPYLFPFHSNMVSIMTNQIVSTSVASPHLAQLYLDALEVPEKDDEDTEKNEGENIEKKFQLINLGKFFIKVFYGN